MTKQHDPRFCATCDRRLPRRAYRTRCASCRKEAAGYVRGPMQHVTRSGQTLWVTRWFKAVEQLAEARND